MDIQIYFLALVVPLLSFSLQIWPRIIKRYFGVDTWRWLFFADYLRTHKALPKKSPKQYIVSSIFGYPPVTIILLSLFPKKLLEKYQFIFSPFFDLLNNYLIFVAAFIFSSSVITAIVAQAVAALIPIIVIEASNLNSRILSYFIFTASFFPLMLYSLNGEIIYLVVAASSLFVLFFTHRFAIQAYIVCIIGFTLAEKNPFYILFFSTIFVLVNLIGGKVYRAILREHISALKYWADKIDYRFAHQFRGQSSQRKESDFIQQIYSLSTKNPLAYIIGNNPWLLVLLPLLINIDFSFVLLVSSVDIVILRKLEIWVVSLLVWTVLVLSIKKLRIFGEGQRYLEYCVLPIATIIGSYILPLFSQFGFISYIVFSIIVVGMVILIAYLQYKAIVLDRARSITKDVWEIIEYLNKNGGSKIRLAMFPLQLGDAILYFTKSSILTSDLYSGLSKLSDLFPVLEKPLSQILKKYKINHIFFDRTYVELEELKLKKYKVLIERNNFVLLKV